MSKPQTITRRALLERWWWFPVAASVGFFVWFGLRAYRFLFDRGGVGQPKFVATTAQRLVAIGALKRVWDAQTFELVRVVGQTTVKTPAILIRTEGPQPGGLSIAGVHHLALSRVCPHLACVCDYIRNPEIAAMSYKYRPENGQPVLGCACHFSAFDPAKAGESMSGPALQPLPRVQLERRGNAIYAVGIEG